ncbi:MAG: hypothetical protein ACRDHK_11235, partial [Actinomycetota bacterium]
MARLFEHGELSEYLSRRLSSAVAKIERVPEDDLLTQSVDSLVERFAGESRCGRVSLDTGSWVGGDVHEASVEVVDDRWRREGTRRMRTTRVTAEFRWQGNRDLFLYRPTTHLLAEFHADVRDEIVAVTYERPGDDIPPEVVRQGVGEVIGRIAFMLDHANNDVDRHNASVESRIRAAVEARRERVLKRRDLRGALGFPLSRREEAPRTLPVERRVLGPVRRDVRPRSSRTYADEWALDQGDYEDVITVITGMLRACERTPSVVGEKDEESLRDLVLIVLNGTYQGMATGETFVASGKTDILVRVEDRHVFVGECKWWEGEKAFLAAVDQLLSYLPWRDEKAAPGHLHQPEERLRRDRQGRRGHSPAPRLQAGRPQGPRPPE